MITDYPPTRNGTAPSIDAKVRSALSSIHRIEGQFPLFRVVYGQWYEVGYVYASEWHLTYRHHVERTQVLGEPVYTLDGTAKTDELGNLKFSRLYTKGDVIPAIPLVAIERCEDIGINRWFVELAEPVDGAEWEAMRYLDETGQVHFDDAGNRLDFAGEAPDGLIQYTELYCVARHDKECCEGTQLDPITKARCYGHYRHPSAIDVDACTKMYKEMLRQRPASYGFRDRVPAAVLANKVLAAYGKKDETDLIRRNEIEDELQQLLLPHSKRVADGIGQELSGKDKFKYVDVGGVLETLRSNETNPDAYTGKDKDN